MRITLRNLGFDGREGIFPVETRMMSLRYYPANSALVDWGEDRERRDRRAVMSAM
jgi:hypothetical protein